MKQKYKISELSKIYGMTDNQMIDLLLKNEFMISDDNEITKTSTKKLHEILSNENKNIDNINLSSLKSIRIEKLFGNRTFDIDFKNSINIFLSENGQGKTTVLKIIVAILNNDVRTLSNINFEEILIKINNKEFKINNNSKRFDKEIKRKINKSSLELSTFLPIKLRNKIKYQISKGEIPNFVEIKNDLSKYRSNYMHTNYMREDYKEIYTSLCELDELINNKTSRILNEIEKELKENLYFYPTYRRIETPLEYDSKELVKNSNFLEHGKFGMDDVKVLINNLLEKLSIEANKSYIEMNSSIINDLISGKTIEELSLNTSSIEDYKITTITKRIGIERINNINELMKSTQKNEPNNSNRVFLNYYLNQLVKIYDSQKAIEEKLKKFVKVCSKYLSNNKKIEYNETTMSIYVIMDNSKIDFNDLSSGEKQIISIFSRVYLEITTPCILIIDEPEISLSIEWQKTFLVDIYKSGKVSLLIATTHSPFIFSNEFRKFAMDLGLKILKETN